MMVKPYPIEIFVEKPWKKTMLGNLVRSIPGPQSEMQALREPSIFLSSKLPALACFKAFVTANISLPNTGSKLGHDLTD